LHCIFFKKTADLQQFLPHDLPEGGTAPFSQEIQKLSSETLQNMEAWSIKALKTALISRKLKIAQDAKA